MNLPSLTVVAIFAAALISVIAMIVLPLYLAIRHEFARAKAGPRARRTLNWINGITEIAGSFAVVAVTGLVLAQVAVVVLRYFFSAGSIELQEAVVYLHAIVFMLGAGVTLMRDEHVRLDVVYAKLSPRARAMVNLIGTVLLLIPFAMTVALTGFDYVGRSWATRESSIEASGLNFVYLLKTVIVIFAVLLLLQAINWIVSAIRVLRDPASNGSETVSDHATRRQG